MTSWKKIGLAARFYLFIQYIRVWNWATPRMLLSQEERDEMLEVLVEIGTSDPKVRKLYDFVANAEIGKAIVYEHTSS
jgi:hypothetical protein